MTREQAIKEFKQTYIGLYINHADYGKAYEAWSFYIDDLCKSGAITQRQYDTWTAPFKYGKPLSPTKRMLEDYVSNFGSI